MEEEDRGPMLCEKPKITGGWCNRVAVLSVLPAPPFTGKGGMLLCREHVIEAIDRVEPMVEGEARKARWARDYDPTIEVKPG